LTKANNEKENNNNNKKTSIFNQRKERRSDMGLSKARNPLLVLVITAYLFSGTAHAWSWSWGSGQSGSNWGWGWGSDDNSGSGSGGGSSWGWGWSSNGTDTNWGWGSSSGSSGTGSTHKSYHNHTAPSNHSNGSGSIGSTHNNHTAQVSPRRKIEVSVWKNGFDYQEWASKHAPFHTNDVLSFKGKKLVARGGSSLGFKLLLRKTPETYYFASGDHNGCNHSMKFSVSPIPRSSSHTKP
ncbi:hypothetical protein HID58_057092, partial [Brassica napus]